MAVRRVRATPQTAGATSPPAVWPYVVLSESVTVRDDGSVLVPASLAAMIGEPGEAITVTFSSDGHIEIDGSGPRISPPDRKGVVGPHTTEEFLELLDGLPGAV